MKTAIHSRSKKLYSSRRLVAIGSDVGELNVKFIEEGAEPHRARIRGKE